MKTAGGFILEADTLEGLAGPSSERSLNEEGTSSYSQESISIRKLSSQQEVRLMNYLDDAFMQVNRGYNKRHDIETSSVPNIQSFLESYEAILVIIASIPPIGPSASLLVSYLLRYTNEILDGIVGYEPGNLDGSNEASNFIDRDLKLVVHHLNILDRVWSCVLRGQLVDLQAVKRNLIRDAEVVPFDLFPQGNKNDDGKIGMNENRNRDSGRYPPTRPSEIVKEGKSVMGSKGYSTVAQTHRIRLRNLIALGRENLFEWMRIQLNVPLPPKIDADEDEELVTRPGHSNATTIRRMKISSQIKEEEEEDEEIDLEEIDTSTRADKTSDQGQGQVTGKHYENLFLRKIDPDASDTDEDADEDDEYESQYHKPNGKRNSDPLEISSLTKKAKMEISNGEISSSTTPTDDSESLATFSGTEAVMKWDISFAHLFSHTLKCLSDIQEYSNHRNSTRQEADETI